MQINIPKVIVQAPLAEYASELAGKFLHVWVNPPMEKLNAYHALVNQIQVRELEQAKKMFAKPADNSDVPAEAKDVPLLERIFDLFGRYSRSKPAKKEGVAEDILNWYVEIWSQGPTDTHWTLAELQTLEQQDPAFLGWMIARTWQVRTEHVERKKKS